MRILFPLASKRENAPVLSALEQNNMPPTENDSLDRQRLKSKRKKTTRNATKWSFKVFFKWQMSNNNKDSSQEQCSFKVDLAKIQSLDLNIANMNVRSLNMKHYITPLVAFNNASYSVAFHGSSIVPAISLWPHSNRFIMGLIGLITKYDTLLTSLEKFIRLVKTAMKMDEYSKKRHLSLKHIWEVKVLLTCDVTKIFLRT